MIHLGDGRYINKKTVEELFTAPPPPPPKKYTKAARVLCKRTKKKSPKTSKPWTAGDNHHRKKLINSLVGYKEWWWYKNEIMGKYRSAGRAYCEVIGLSRSQMGYVMGHVKRKVKKDMENIEKVHPDLSEMAKEALEGAITVLRAPGSQQIKLSAAKLILEFTKSKPVAKSEVSVQSAEAWLASLGKD